MPSPFQSDVDTKVHAQNDIHTASVSWTTAPSNSTNVPVVRLPYAAEIVSFNVVATGASTSSTATFTLQDGGSKGTATTAISSAGTFASAAAGSTLSLTESGKTVAAGNWLTVGVTTSGSPAANVFNATVAFTYRDL